LVCLDREKSGNPADPPTATLTKNWRLLGYCVIANVTRCATVLAMFFSTANLCKVL
jgi:hypothetical protein